MMTLERLKALMGISSADSSQDDILSLYLSTAIEAAKVYANAYDWTLTGELPAGIQLGIVRWVELSQMKKLNAGVQSESMAGMSQTFISGNDAAYFSEVYDFWGPYHKKDNGLVFRNVRKSKPVSQGYNWAGPQ